VRGLYYTKLKEDIRRSTKLFQILDLLLLEAQAAQRRVVSKIDAKFPTF